MAARTLGLTADMTRALPDDGNRYEVLGRALIVTRAPQELHQRLVAARSRLSSSMLESIDSGEYHCSPATFVVPRRMVHPDVFPTPWVERARGVPRDQRTLV
jgi:hypothetical protein